MHCFSSRVTSWLTRTLRVGGFVLRRRIGASVIRPSHFGWPTQRQRRAQEAVAVVWPQPIPRDRDRQIEGKFCTIVGGVFCPLWVTPAEPAVDEIGSRRARSTCRRFTRAEVQGVSVVVVRACGCGSLPRTLLAGRDAERPSPESSPFVAVSGGRAEAKRSRAERPALSKSAVGPARDCGPPGGGRAT